MALEDGIACHKNVVSDDFGARIKWRAKCTPGRIKRAPWMKFESALGMSTLEK